MDTNNKINGHYENHIHVFMDESDKVIAVYLFESCGIEETINHVLDVTKAKRFLSLCDGDYANPFDITIDYKYENNIFYPPQPYPSWIKDEEFPTWHAPVAKPTATKSLDGSDIFWIWNEENKWWDQMVFEEVNPEDQTELPVVGEAPPAPKNRLF
jgi:hypothetical protein